MSFQTWQTCVPRSYTHQYSRLQYPVSTYTDYSSHSTRSRSENWDPIARSIRTHTDIVLHKPENHMFFIRLQHIKEALIFQPFCFVSCMWACSCISGRALDCTHQIWFVIPIVSDFCLLSNAFHTLPPLQSAASSVTHAHNFLLVQWPGVYGREWWRGEGERQRPKCQMKILENCIYMQKMWLRIIPFCKHLSGTSFAETKWYTWACRNGHKRNL